MPRIFDFICDNCGYSQRDIDVNGDFRYIFGIFDSSKRYKCPFCNKEDGFGVDFSNTYTGFTFKINGYSYNNGYSTNNTNNKENNGD